MRTLTIFPALILLLVACTSAPAPTATALPPAPVPSTETAPTSPFPLRTGTTWTYDYTAYTENASGTWRVTETILKTEQQGSMLLATAARTAILVSGKDTEQIFTAPESYTFWYIFDQNRLKRAYKELSSPDFDSAVSLEIIFPLDGSTNWPVSPTDGPCVPEEIFPGCRYVAAGPQEIETPAGKFNQCYQLVTPYNNGPILETYCENIGFVSGKYTHLGSPMGYEYNLIEFSSPSE
jgi:hypothetical protein